MAFLRIRIVSHGPRDPTKAHALSSPPSAAATGPLKRAPPLPSRRQQQRRQLWQQLESAAAAVDVSEWEAPSSGTSPCIMAAGVPWLLLHWAWSEQHLHRFGRHCKAAHRDPGLDGEDA